MKVSSFESAATSSLPVDDRTPALGMPVMPVEPERTSMRDSVVIASNPTRSVDGLLPKRKEPIAPPLARRLSQFLQAIIQRSAFSRTSLSDSPVNDSEEPFRPSLPIT